MTDYCIISLHVASSVIAVLSMVNFFVERLRKVSKSGENNHVMHDSCILSLLLIAFMMLLTFLLWLLFIFFFRLIVITSLQHMRSISNCFDTLSFLLSLVRAKTMSCQFVRIAINLAETSTHTHTEKERCRFIFFSKESLHTIYFECSINFIVSYFIHIPQTIKSIHVIWSMLITFNTIPTIISSYKIHSDARNFRTGLFSKL